MKQKETLAKDIYEKKQNTDTSEEPLDKQKSLRLSVECVKVIFATDNGKSLGSLPFPKSVSWLGSHKCNLELRT